MAKHLCFFVLSIGLWVTSANAQLTGTKNIPGDYPTLAAAIIDVNAQGVGAGGVVINLSASETAPAGGYVITVSGTPTNPIILSGNNSVVTASASQTVGSISDGVFKIVGGDYIRIQNFIMQENPANTVAAPATNNMTEWGVALLRATTNNGASANTISGNTISLNRAYTNTFGIYSNVRHASNTPTVTEEVSSTNGSNSNNVVRSNQISNVNAGIAFIGSAQPFWMDGNNDIGGNTAATGNTITNWGGAAAASAYVSNVATCYGILVNHQVGYNVSWNTLTSATVAPTSGFRGILQEYTLSPGPGTVTNNIKNNTVTMTSGQTSGIFRAIEANGGQTSNTLYILNNAIRNCVLTNASAPTFSGILQTGSINRLYINGNIFEGNSTSSTFGGFTAISNTGFVNTSINIDNNDLGTATAGLVTFSAANSGTVTGITNSGGAAGCLLYIEGNDFRGIVHVVNGSASHTYISNTAANPNTSIRLNTFTALHVNTTGNITFISNSVTHAANTSHNVSSNTVVSGFTKGLSGGTVYFYYAAGASGTSVSEINDYNDFSNMSFTGSTIIQGWVNTDGAATSPYGSSKNMANNVFSNITAGSSSVQLMQMDRSNSTSSMIGNNIVSNITSSGNITAMVTTEGNQSIAGNIINGLHSTAASGVVTAILVSGGAAQDVFKNRIYDLQADGANSSVSAIRVSAATASLIDDNLIGNLFTPNANTVNPIVGINMTTASGTFQIYYNTVYLNAVSTGVNFGCSGISVNTGASIDLRNNLVVNLSTPNGTGTAVAYRRSSASLINYSTQSGNNSFYAGVPSPAHLIFSDGTNNDQTLTAFKTRVAPSDAATITYNTPFISTSGAAFGFLHIPAAAPNPLESAGVAVALVSGDIDGQNRPGPTGSVNGGGFAPDIGADEFDGGLTCAGAPSGGSAGITPASFCATGTFTLTVSGATSAPGITYQWQQSSVSGGPYSDIAGANSQTYTATVSSTTYYALLVSCAYGQSTATSNEIVALIHLLPLVDATASDTIFCSGENITLSGSGAFSYSWSGGVTDGVPFVPAGSGTYTVTGTDSNGCQQTDSIALILAAPPAVMGVTSADSVCAGDSVVLHGNGAVSYQWTGNVIDNVAFVPALTDTYIVTGTDMNGCTGSDTIAITVNSLPNVAAHVNDSAICAGTPIVFNGSGAITYSWSGGVSDNIVFTPSSTATFTVTGADQNGCTDSDSIAIMVYPLPNVQAFATDDSVCIGTSVTCFANGGTAYVWSGGITDSIAFTPLASEVYIVTGTDSNGCSNTDSIAVTVNLLPAVIAYVTDDTICAGSVVTCSGAGAMSYVWSGGVIDNMPFVPAASDTFNVTGTDINGCTNTDTVSVVVHALPTANLQLTQDTACFSAGNIVLMGGSPSGGTWSGPGVTGNVFDPSVAGMGTVAITYLYTDTVTGCSTSVIDSMVVDICNSAFNGSAKNPILLYPNPFTDAFTLEIPVNPDEGTVDIVNAQGELVQRYATQMTRLEINLAGEPSGVFAVIITQNGVTSVYRVVKM